MTGGPDMDQDAAFHERWARLGRDVSGALGDGPNPEALRRQREAFMRRMPARTPKPRRRWWVLAGAGVALVAPVVLFVLPPIAAQRARRHTRQAPAVSTNDRTPWPEPIALGDDDDAWLQAPRDGALTIALGANGEARLDKGARARVQRAGDKHARLIVESGTLGVSLASNDQGTRWTVYAGAYRVAVLGAVFHMSYAPDADQLDVTMSSGHATVTGGHLQHEVVALVGGQRFSARADGVRLAPWDGNGDGVTDENNSDADAIVPAPREHDGPATRHPRADDGAWRALYRAGAYADALEAARADGFAQVTRESDAPALLDLADTARLGGDAARARQVLLSLRQRFTNSESAGSAAFLLGKLDADGPARFASAAAWFARSLREHPSGPYAPEALGRLMVAYDHAGQRARALDAATRYLERYPRGPYVDLARRLAFAAPAISPR